jgi:hypothetical protein
MIYEVGITIQCDLTAYSPINWYPCQIEQVVPIRAVREEVPHSTRERASRPPMA